MKLNKPWDEQDHDAHYIEVPMGTDDNGDTVYWGFNGGTYWGCRNCPDEFLVNEVPKPKDGLCLDCRSILCQEDAGLS
tara:strand:- start:319 stop:552 length:234 start_codon:yes stop_codon:yes gene_type:complete